MANIIVTGSNRGLGLEFVKQLSRFSKSYNIFALCRDPEGSEKLKTIAKESQNIRVIKADMVQFKEYKTVISNIENHIKIGGINMLINNAGIMKRDTVNTVKYENIINSFEINAVAPLLFTQALLPLLKKADPTNFPLKMGNSVVLNVSAHLGSIEENTTGHYTSYRLSKAAINMATKSLAVELKSSRLFVMALHPGWVKTNMGGEEAPISPEVSVSGMLTVLSRADESYNGHLYNYKGHKIPW